LACLEAGGEGVGGDVGGRRQARLEPVHDGSRVETLLDGRSLERARHLLVLVDADPALGDEDVALDVELALVQRVEDHLQQDQDNYIRSHTINRDIYIYIYIYIYI